MRYVEPHERDPTEIEHALASSRAEVVQHALIDAAHYADGDWIQRRALALIKDHRMEVRETALVSLAVLARRGVLDLDAESWTILESCHRDDHLADAVEMVLDDLEDYMGVVRPEWSTGDASGADVADD